MHTTSAIFVAIAAGLVLADDASPPQPEITPFADHRPRINVYLDAPALKPTNALESSCIDTFISFRGNAPKITNKDLLRWMEETAAPQMKTVTHISEVDDMCITTDDFTPPATLASAYTAMMEDFSSWKVKTHDEVQKMAEKCGKISPLFMAHVATDVEECRTAVSVLFGATRGATGTTTAEATATGVGAGTGTAGRSTGSGAVVKETAAPTATTTANGGGGESGAASRGVTGGFVGAVVVLVSVAGLFVGL